MNRRLRRAIRRARVRRWRARPYTSTAAPIVVGGCGRSGTTLMRVILDSHPRICCGPESLLFLADPVDAGRIAVLAERFDLQPEEIRRLRLAAASQAEFVDRFFARCCDRSGKTRWAEKTPRNVHALDFVFEHFPRAVFVHMIRDGRDTACSLRTHPRHAVRDGQLVELGTWKPIEQCARRWVNDVRAGLAYRGHPGYVELRYEDLVLRPEATLRGILERLGEPWDDRVLEFDSVSRDVSAFPQNPEATRPIYRSALGRWHHDMSVEDARSFKRVGGALLVELGYAEDTSWWPAAAAEAVR
ncbi:MAG: sulfotransferase [Thermoleophilia bacterium]|nr:sulfotransferase [Thermoleophilia bacterium]